MQLYYILLAIVIPLFAQKGDKITLAGKLGSEPSVITNMYKILIEDETDDTLLMLKTEWVKHRFI